MAYARSTFFPSQQFIHASSSRSERGMGIQASTCSDLSADHVLALVGVYGGEEDKDIFDDQSLLSFNNTTLLR